MSAPYGQLARRLRAIEVFSDLRDEELAWLAERAMVVELEPGGVLRRKGDPADVMLAVLEGEMRSRLGEGDADGRLFVRRAGPVGAMLPHSRLTHFPGTVRAGVRTTLACFAKSDFPAMLERIPVLEQRLASVMTDRVRETTHFELHRERLAGLGKLAAGLAHELNNPISVIQRAVAEMERSTEDLVAVARELLRDAVGDEALDRVETLDPEASGGPGEAGERLADGEAEDAVTATLEQLGVERPWVLAADLVVRGVRADALARAVEGVDPAAAERLLRWREAARSAEAVRRELAAAAGRVVGLVAAVKGFSQLDRAQVTAELDVRDGLADTLVVMAHALRDRQVTVREDHAPALPRVRGVVGQLNQVWLNLLDNAVDAAGAGGTVTLRTHAHETEVLIDVEDDGHGIPEAIVWRVFEPFFTTKPVGEGTGLGLEVVRRVVMEHGGDVNVESAPGRTVFQVRLPAVDAARRTGP